ncbi:BatD family protein [Adhaeribacter sp. BT258]|uniref:BatD family protein n=1 Tax=Adhaeribacter terrigena TaxID=2793070 RepID=A0ABS1BWK5_9BACT|nr:BatD family protein [Adhaeribacter terrigena]MBK0401500.1 BatD family protein [Adhaeribacter terrigena]
MKKRLILFCLLLLPFLPAFAQEIVVKLGKSPVPIDEYFTISVTLKNEQLKTIGKFPEIEGFEKSNRFSSTQTNTVNGQVSSVEQTITQNYAALKEGEFPVKPFSIEVNGRKVESKGGTVKVGPPATKAAPPLQGFGLLDELFGKQKPQEYIDKKEDAFLAFSTGKDEIFAGEGLPVNLSFYVARGDERLLDFYEFNRQYSEMLKKLKPANAWEESFAQTSVEPEIVTIDKKEYLRYKLYEAVYFPINTEPLLFPSVGLNMIKYRIAKEPDIFGESRLPSYKTYYTAPKIVPVKPPPPHPLQSGVPVGDYRLNEQLSTRQFTVGKSFTYTFEIAGEGNLAVLNAPVPEPVPGLEFTAPDVQQHIIRQNGRVSGRKSYAYFVTPKKPGTFDLKPVFSFIFFNPNTAQYDTLQSELQIHVTGEADNDAAIQAKDMGQFYERIETESNELVSLNQFTQVKMYTNLVVIFLAGISLFLFYKNRA